MRIIKGFVLIKAGRDQIEAANELKSKLQRFGDVDGVSGKQFLPVPSTTAISGLPDG